MEPVPGQSYGPHGSGSVTLARLQPNTPAPAKYPGSGSETLGRYGTIPICLNNMNMILNSLNSYPDPNKSFRIHST